jgi:hypothetical protein
METVENEVTNEEGNQEIVTEEVEQEKEYRAEGNINLEETESKMTIEVDNDTLSVEQANEVAISVTLKTDEERYDLFENPEIILEFPAVVEKVDISMINLLYKNGLSIESWNIYTNVSGNQVIDVRLSGSQLEYTPRVCSRRNYLSNIYECVC